jgi:hypothetical protein
VDIEDFGQLHCPKKLRKISELHFGKISAPHGILVAKGFKKYEFIQQMYMPKFYLRKNARNKKMKT